MEKKKDIECFVKILEIATSRIEQEYFLLPTAGEEEAIYRERVYCYELYHRLREEFDKSKFLYSLGGEVDKREHYIIYTKMGAVKPDLIVHVPGTMKHNLVVIEVKPIKAEAGDVKEDLRKLMKFLTEAEYYRAIHLVYGGTKEEIREYIKRSFDREKLKFTDSTYLFWHEAPQKPARIYNWAELVSNRLR